MEEVEFHIVGAEEFFVGELFISDTLFSYRATSANYFWVSASTTIFIFIFYSILFFLR